MKFNYEGIDLTLKQPETGEVEALTEAEAHHLLQQRNIEVTRLVVQENKVEGKKKVTVSDLVVPLQELATLTESGVILVDALNALAQNKMHYGLAQGFRKLASAIEGGESFSKSIASSKLPFPTYVEHLVHAGELSGQLSNALNNAAAQLKYDEAIRNDLRAALTYPLVLIGSGLVAMLIIFFAVVPKFSHMLDNEKELPTLAWFVLSAGRYANEYPWLIASGFIGVLLLIVGAVTNKRIQSKIMNIAIGLPVIGPWLAEQDAARWAALCGAMLTARVNLVTALSLAAQSSAFTRRRARAEQIADDIQAGTALPEAIERSALLPGTSLNLLNVGDKTGKLAEMMGAVARLHDESCKRRMKQVMTLIEPLAILIVGVLIGIMILGIVLAITASTDIAI
ncbi:type II secretion system F family protein [Alteromonas gilva]|uniref:Type II secretion system F family protein n=1 Tax=Alteromonas gilva TaxID=2987522 RepID=A0ABT5L7H0_9ALTE|nr:type II secretion system F family protein [Alteromonas gilva]MDC8833005.1 type II secretion system F family protein [Alteromonas gilva]